MASIKLTGDTSGVITVSAPASAGTNTITLPATTGTMALTSDIDLTALNASNLTSGTVPDARFPATLPAANGSALTALVAGNIATGTVPTARLGSGTASSSTFLRGDSTYAEAGGGKLLAQTTLVNSTRQALSTSTGTFISFGTYAKTAASSRIIIMINISGIGSYSSSCGQGIKHDSTVIYGGWNATQTRMAMSQISDFGTAGGIGTKTVSWGWDVANSTASRPFDVLNPNASDDARARQSISTITIWEIA
jgi:hypothetical protein